MAEYTPSFLGDFKERLKRDQTFLAERLDLEGLLSALQKAKRVITVEEYKSVKRTFDTKGAKQGTEQLVVYLMKKGTGHNEW